MNMTAEQFNAIVSVRDKIYYHDDDGKLVSGIVVNQASNLADGTPVMWLKGISGGYDLQRFVSLG